MNLILKRFETYKEFKRFNTRTLDFSEYVLSNLEINIENGCFFKRFFFYYGVYYNGEELELIIRNKAIRLRDVVDCTLQSHKGIINTFRLSLRNKKKIRINYLSLYLKNIWDFSYDGIDEMNDDFFSHLVDLINDVDMQKYCINDWERTLKNNKKP